MFCLFWLNGASVIGYWGVWGWRCHNGKDNRRERGRPSQFFHSLKPSYLHPLFSFFKIIVRLDIRSTSITSIYPLNTSTCHSAKRQQGAYMWVKWDRIYIQYNRHFSFVCVSFLCLVFSSNRPKVSMKMSKVGVRERQLLVSSFGT